MQSYASKQIDRQKGAGKGCEGRGFVSTGRKSALYSTWEIQSSEEAIVPKCPVATLLPKFIELLRFLSKKCNWMHPIFVNRALCRQISTCFRLCLSL